MAPIVLIRPYSGLHRATFLSCDQPGTFGGLLTVKRYWRRELRLLARRALTVSVNLLGKSQPETRNA